tara:strand:+ start:217 stop:483 length:267 start_codon:yes stop_codon:yes gene_type:complete
MEKFLYNYFGYNKECIENNNAIVIQKAYRNFKNYKKKKLIDNIVYFNIFNNNEKSNEELDKEYKEEIEYWENMRKSIKNKILDNYVFI